MKTMQAVAAGSRAVGDAIQVGDAVTGSGYVGRVAKITKTFVTVSYLGTDTRYHRATGYVVGFTWPGFTRVIAPETSKGA